MGLQTQRLSSDDHSKPVDSSQAQVSVEYFIPRMFAQVQRSLERVAVGPEQAIQEPSEDSNCPAGHDELVEGA